MTVRPLKKTYSPTHPYVVERHDQEDGSIQYELWDTRPDTYRRVCVIPEEYVDEDGEVEIKTRGQAKTDADMIARALNLMNGGLP